MHVRRVGTSRPAIVRVAATMELGPSDIWSIIPTRNESVLSTGSLWLNSVEWWASEPVLFLVPEIAGTTVVPSGSYTVTNGVCPSKAALTGASAVQLTYPVPDADWTSSFLEDNVVLWGAEHGYKTFDPPTGTFWINSLANYDGLGGYIVFQVQTTAACTFTINVSFSFPEWTLV